MLDNELASSFGNRATVVRPAPPRDATMSERDTAAVQRLLDGDLKRIVAWTIRSVLLSIAMVLVGLWLQDGGIADVHSEASLLTSIGRITGLAGAYLLLLQVLLMAHLPFMEWVAGFDRLAGWHRFNGKLCLALILAHVATITLGYAITDGISVPAEALILLANYPGMVTALFGTIMLILVALTSIVIVRRRLRYETWYLVHLMSYLGILLAWFHQVPAGTVFFNNPVAAAFWLALYVATLQLVLLFRVGQPALSSLWHRLRVAEVIQESPGVVSLRITGHHLDWLNARAGQFFQWRFLDRERWHEAHPFSLSAAPDGTSFRITVKALGDFSSRIGGIKLGTYVIAKGPFGSFTEAARTQDASVLIAGGIGITPIRALLEEIHGHTVLIYRASSAADLIFRDEIEQLARKQGAALRYLVGGRRLVGGSQALSPEHLRRLVPDIAMRDIFVCGPRPMMQTVRRSALRAGVPPERIHMDDFAF